jgi:hypothetical protein
MRWRLLSVFFLFNISRAEDDGWEVLGGSRSLDEKGKSLGEVIDTLFQWKKVHPFVRWFPGFASSSF